MPATTRLLPPLAAAFLVSAASPAAQEPPEPEIAIMWEIEGQGHCAYLPPPDDPSWFQFGDSDRWSFSATDPPFLGQGDPMTLTWSFIPDGAAQGSGFTCGVPGETAGAASNLIGFLDGLHGDGPGGSDLTQRPWFPIFEQAFDNWGLLNGVDYVYEPADDGAFAGSWGETGVLGVRGDVRIGGHYIDGQSGANVLGCNYFPNNGDMILDTSNSSFYDPAPPGNRGFRNVLEHEHGHGLGFSHVCPLVETKLMEPFVSLAFLGAQEDDILAANRGYGDRDEFPAENDTVGTATSLGAIAVEDSVVRQTLSIDDNGDQDFYSFAAPAGAKATITITPTGTTYLQGPQTAQCDSGSSFNALTQSDLGVELRGLSGLDVLASSNIGGPGVPESIVEALLGEGAGTYFARIFGLHNAAQMYDLSVSLESAGADLSITKTSGVDPVPSGSVLTYTVSLVNGGPDPAASVVVTDTLPAGVTFLSTSGCDNDPNGVPSCVLGTLGASAGTSYTISVTVDAGPGTISNTADVTAATTDPDMADNSSTVVTTVIEAPPCVADHVLTAADNGTSPAYAASSSISTGAGFEVGVGENVTFTAGSLIVLGNDSTFSGASAFVLDPSVCP